eukprot:6492152-Amphidinium_carterae.1
MAKQHLLPETMKEVWKRYVWSWQACLCNQHPQKDWNGEEFPIESWRYKVAGSKLNANGFFLACFAITGDLEELVNTYKLQHYNANEACFWCKANTTSLPWSDLSPHAGWRGTLRVCSAIPNDHDLWTIPGGLMSETQMVAKLPARPIAHLAHKGLGIANVAWDILHGLDLGPTLHLAGNILQDLVENEFWGSNQDARIGALWQRVDAIYKEHKIKSRLPHLDLNSFQHTGHYPKLRAKANQARHFVPVLLQLLQETPAMGSGEYVKHRLLCTQALISLYQVFESAGLLLSNGEAATATKYGNEFLFHYNWLAVGSMRAGRLRWQVTIKFHYLAHMETWLAHGNNPKYLSTYGGEDFVGKIARIGKACTAGKPTYRIASLLLSKLQAGRACRLRTGME